MVESETYAFCRFKKTEKAFSLSCGCVQHFELCAILPRTWGVYRIASGCFAVVDLACISDVLPNTDLSISL